MATQNTAMDNAALIKEVNEAHKHKKYSVGYHAQTVVAVIVTLIMLFPLYWMIATSFKSAEEVQLVIPTLFPHEFHPENYLNVLQKANFMKYYWNTIVMTAGILLLQVGTGVLAAYGFAVGRFKGRNVLFYVVLGALAFLKLEGWLAVLPVLIVYIVILRNLVKLARSLADTGYTIHAAPVRLPSTAVLWGYLGLTLAAVLLAMFLGQRYPMNWQVRDDAPQDETIRVELLDLGFPEQVLDDLTAEEAAHMSGAVKVYTETEPLYEDYTYREVTTSVWNEDPPPRWEYSSAEKQPDGSYRYTYRVYDLYEGFVTHVVVLVEEAGRQRAVVLHYAAIDRPFGDCLAEGMEIWPVWQGNEESWSPGGWYSGRLLCEKDGQSYAADFYSVESGSYETTNIFGTTQNTGMIAEWSRMRRGENTRAYLLYDAEMLTPELPSLYSWCNYVRQTKPVYPFRDALTLWHEWNTNGCYEKWQTSIQIWPPVEEETE
mgnify:CR=1 FL=1